AYGALARHFRSANHTDAELASGLWPRLRTAATEAGLDDPGAKPYAFEHYTYQRDRLIKDDERRELLLTEFTAIAVSHARRLGLLKPKGPGSLTYPHPTRTIYGDGTIVRPLYRPPRPHDYITDPHTRKEIPPYPNTTTGEDSPHPHGYITVPDTSTQIPRYLITTTGEVPTSRPVRHYPSAAVHGRHDGIVNGNDFVLFSPRDEHPGTRVILGIERVPRPNQEAD